MGLFDWIAPRPQGEATWQRAASGASVQSESQWRGLRWGGAPSRAGVRIDETTAMSVPALLQAVRVLCGVFAMAPLNYFEQTATGRRRADESPLQNLFHRRPNEVQTPFAFKEQLLQDVVFRGNHFSYISRALDGTPRALTRLKPQGAIISEFFDRSGGLVRFYDATLPDGTRERFPARDIWHVPGLSLDGVYGLSPVALTRDAIGGAVATQQHVASFWGSGGAPKTVLRTTQKVGQDVKERLRADWNARYAGPDGEAIAVLDQDLDVKFITENHEASQFIETRGFQIVDVARIIGVPPHLLFDLSRATFSNIEQQSLELVLYHLGPQFVRVAQAATHAFAEDGYYFEHLTDALTRGDIMARWQAYRIQREVGAVNANELRRRENMTDIPGPAGEDYWRPGNMFRADDPSPTAPSQETAP
jgi:HK97 family phage portal protein